MRAWFAFLKKEWMESFRSGKLAILLILFVLFGIMNPAIAKLTPWLMELMADQLAGSGLTVGTAEVNALTSWAQFFKNIPMALIVFVLIYSNSFTKEYQTGTLIPMLTKGLPRGKVVHAKASCMLSVWTLCYWLCFAVTYGYNAFFWDNGIAQDLGLAALLWWLFGIWTVCLTVLFSTVCRNHTGVLLGTGGTVLAAYLIALLPKLREFSPMYLTTGSALLTEATAPDAYARSIAVTAILCIVCALVSTPVINRKQL